MRLCNPDITTINRFQYLMKHRFLPTALAILSLAGCAGHYEITEAELQSSLGQRLPLQREFHFAGAAANLTVTKVAVHLPQNADEKVRLAAKGLVTTTFRGLALSQPFEGEIRGVPRFEEKTGEIYLAENEVTYLDAPVLAKFLPPKVYSDLYQHSERLLMDVLGKRPIYTVRNRNLAEAVFKSRGKAIETGNGKLVFRLM